MSSRHTMVEFLSEKGNGSHVHLDYSFHLDSEFKFSPCIDADSVGSSVESGLRNSLHSSFDFNELEEFIDDENSEDDASFGDGMDRKTPSWRLHPEESGSDWTLIVQSEADGRYAKYNVHRHMLAQGFKKSDFFVTLFIMGAEEKVDDYEMGFNTTKLYGDAAKLVPDLLDYLYSANDILKISTETAVGLRYLSQFFGIRALATEVVSFIYEDMTIENMRTYIAAAVAFEDLQTMKLCSTRCAQNIKDVSPFSFLLRDMDASFLLDIISYPKADRKRCSAHMSLLVSVYCNLFRQRMDSSVFEELTSGEYLPVISEDAALSLLILEGEIMPDSAIESMGLTNLQSRCVNALLLASQQQQAAQEVVGDNTRQKTRMVLSSLPKKILVELLSMSLNVTTSNSTLVEL